MIQVLGVLSMLGIIQGLSLALIFYIRRASNHANRWLSLLFILFSTILLLITASNYFLGSFDLHVIEFEATFLSGPFLYLVTIQVLSRGVNRKVWLHFVPFVVYIVWPIDISIIIPLIHFQLYTCWLLITLMNGKHFKMDKEEPGDWLVMIALLLVCIHIAQWIRYAFADVHEIELIVPATASTGFYLFTLWGLFKSQLFVFKQKYKNITLTDGEIETYRMKLIALVSDEEVHTKVGLTLEKLADKMEIPAHVVSRIINDSLGSNFNELINTYRIESAKKYLKNPDNNHFTIEALAQKSGFRSRSSFYSAFRKYTGTNPSSFRP